MRANPTPAERKLSLALRELTMSKAIPGMRHQHRMLGYIVDFYCSKHRLIIELDGRHHYEDKTQAAWDLRRDAVFKRAGYETIRFPNAMVMSNIEQVLNQIQEAMRNRPTWANWNKVLPDGGTPKSMAAHLDPQAERWNPKRRASGNSTK